MSNQRMLPQALGLVMGVVLLLGCGRAPVGPTVASEHTASEAPEPTASSTATASATATPTSTVTPTATATASPTPTVTTTATPTATPTPTALRVVVSGNLRRVISTTPLPQSGAPCGVVDTFDFPLNPPNAESVFRPYDYGVYRSHYGGYHTGEDWWGPGGRSFGLSVHSIGHGKVTYAAPLGWGADKGTVVVQHMLSDGSAIFAFYGHLDPPSVVLRPGDCVVRGEQVGRIGRPSSPPHLHFEIRKHTPDAPGPGYWPSDPTLAGWEPPSQYIWDYRIAASPGVLWTRPYAAWGVRGVGMLNHDTFVAIEDDQLVGIDVSDGSLRWSQTSSIRATDAIIDTGGSMVYAANHYTGRLEAFRIVDSQGSNTTTIPDPPLVPLWQTRLSAAGLVTLMPLPGGGVVASFRQEMFGISAAGELLWQHSSTPRAFDWLLLNDRLIFSTIGEGGSLWTADEAGPVAWTTATGGHLVAGGDQVWVYGENGVYRLDPETLSVHLLYALPRGRLEQGAMIALPDGGVLLTHADAFDRRLIALQADGTLNWQRSYANSSVQGQEHRLVVLDGRPHFVSYTRTAASNEMSVSVIDGNRVRLMRVFTARGWNRRPEDTWVFASGDDCLLLSIGSGMGSGSIIALDTKVALEAVLQGTSSD